MTTPPLTARTSGAAALGLVAALTGCGGGAGTANDPSFAEVAPIIYEHCTVCHRPGEAAPFPFLSYADVSRRGRQIAMVTESKYMPVWQPAPSRDPAVSAFEGDRSLSEEELALLQEWIANGMPEGPADRVPQPPQWSEDWQLGKPDLVLTMPEAYTLSEEGRDVYRNFVIPATAGGRRYVRAVEWRVENRPVVHHAVLFIDRSGGARAKEEAEPYPGFGGMTPTPAQMPEGQFCGWTPGNIPRPGSEDIAWLLDDRTDIVLQLHMRPTGRPEQVRVGVGLHFSDTPPRRHPMSLRLLSRVIDIPPGKSDYVVEDHYTLPTNLAILGIYPHAHYLGKDLRAWATLPDGTRHQLFHIPNWDFNWQDDYFYEEPLELPRGTKLSMRYVYDNSADNPLNPSSPPRRVVHGEQSDDEMGELMMLVLTETEEDLPILWRDFSWKLLRDSKAYYKLLARSQPDNAGWHRQLAEITLRTGEARESIEHHRRWSELRPGNKGRPYVGRARAMLGSGDFEGAAKTLRGVLERTPDNGEARTLLGRALLKEGRLDEARAELEQVVIKNANDAEANIALGDVEVASNRLDRAADCYRSALKGSHDNIKAMNRLGSLLSGDEAIELYRAAVRIYRQRFLEADQARQVDESQSLQLLATELEARGELEQALTYLEWAARLNPENLELEAQVQRLRKLQESL
ncbi:MAG: hypothetical protein CMJ89_08180 [Planctomycetes bacterium]|jgi:tetratricopeptide (TPR) repeat protein|nr:hypothetical protein [Planctomycetota bacterium]